MACYWLFQWYLSKGSPRTGTHCCSCLRAARRNLASRQKKSDIAFQFAASGVLLGPAVKHEGHTVAAHFVNHSVVSYYSSKSAFDTKNKVHRAQLVLFDIVQKRAHVVTPKYSRKKIAQHHDIRFYDATQTFFTLTHFHQRGNNGTLERPSVVHEVDLQGNVVWEWEPYFSPDLPKCMFFNVRYYPQGDPDCHHINAVQYDPAEQMVYVSMRRLNGFLALHKPSKMVRWVYSELKYLQNMTGVRTYPKYLETPTWLPVCKGMESLWPVSACIYFGFHSLQMVAPNRFVVFVNCDSSLREFSIQHSHGKPVCLRPLKRMTAMDVPKDAKGYAYLLPGHGFLFSVGADHVAIMEDEDHSIELVTQRNNSRSVIWADPLYMGPYLNVNPVGDRLVVTVAHHLLLPSPERAELRCHASDPLVVLCPKAPTFVDLPPFLQPTFVYIPVRTANATWVDVTLHLEMPYKAETSWKARIRS